MADSSRARRGVGIQGQGPVSRTDRLSPPSCQFCFVSGYFPAHLAQLCIARGLGPSKCKTSIHVWEGDPLWLSPCWFYFQSVTDGCWCDVCAKNDSLRDRDNCQATSQPTGRIEGLVPHRGSLSRQTAGKFLRAHSCFL